MKFYLVINISQVVKYKEPVKKQNKETKTNGSR